MSVKVLYFKNFVTNNAMSLQDEGTPPTSGITGTGFAVAKNAVGSYMLMNAGFENTAVQATDALTPPAFSANSCWRSEQPFSGRFLAGEWNMDFRVRASSAAGQQGRVNVRIWKSASAIGMPAQELTGSVVLGSISPPVAQGTPVSSHVMWTPGALMFNNEYLWIQCEWEITTATGNANADVRFFVDNTMNVVTTDFAWPLLPVMFNDIAEAFWAPSGVIGTNSIVGATYHDDIEAEFIAFSPTLLQVSLLGPLLVSSGESFGGTTLVPGEIVLTSYNPYEDMDDIWHAIIVADAQFSFVEFLNRWEIDEYNLLRARMRGITFMGLGMNKKWDIAMTTGLLDTSDPMLPAFKQSLIDQSIISKARADVIFDGIC